MLEFMTSQLDGAANVGSELCRRWGSATQRPLRVAAMYAPDPAFDGRISMAIRGFEADCPDSKVVMVASERLSNWHEHTAMMYMESTFLADETISAVLTATNHFAIGAVKAADKRLSAGAAQGLFVSSFGYKAELAPYLAEDRVFATADELLTRPNQGVWRTMASTMEQASHLGWMTTADVQAAIPSMMGVTLQSSSLLIPSDAEGHIISTMLSSAYNPEVRPLPAPLEDDAAAGLLALQPGDAREGGIGSLILAPTTVYVGIDQLVVQQIDVPANTFQATFWLDMSWYDARLTWTRGQYSGDIQVSKARVWTPDLYVLNHLSETVERDGGETLVTMRNDGTVFWSRKITGEFDCKMHIEPCARLSLWPTLPPPPPPLTRLSHPLAGTPLTFIDATSTSPPLLQAPSLISMDTERRGYPLQWASRSLHSQRASCPLNGCAPRRSAALNGSAALMRGSAASPRGSAFGRDRGLSRSSSATPSGSRANHRTLSHPM